MVLNNLSIYGPCYDLFGRRSDQPLFFRTIAKQDQRRYRLDAIALDDLRIVIDVEFLDPRRAGVLFSKRIDNRRQRAARSAPLRPKIH